MTKAAKAAASDDDGMKKITVEVPTKPRRRRGKDMAVEHHQIVTTFTKEKPIDEYTQKGNDEDALEDILSRQADLSEDEDAAEENTNETDPNEAFLNEVERTHADWSMRVYLLPHYESDGRTDTQAPGRTRVLSFPFNRNTYEDDIALHCARPGWSNWFSIEILKNNVFRKRLAAKRIMPASLAEYQAKGIALPEWMQPQAAPQIAPQIVPQAAPQIIDPLQQLKPTLDVMAQMMKLFGFSPATHAQPTMQPPDDGLTPEERAIAVMLGRNEKIQERLSNGLAARLFGDGHHSESTGISGMDLAKVALEQLPLAIKYFFEGMKESNAQPPQPFAPQPMQPPPQIAPQPMQPPPMPQPHQWMQPPPPQIEQAEQPPIELQFLDSVIRACNAQMPTAAAVAMCLSFEESFPQVSPFIEAFLTMSPAEAAQIAQMMIPPSADVMTQPHALEWIQQLQEGIRHATDDASNGNAEAARTGATS